MNIIGDFDLSSILDVKPLAEYTIAETAFGDRNFNMKLSIANAPPTIYN